MDWSHVRVFLAVAETRSLRAAARRLGTSQPTVGRHLQTLEETMGARLFDRRPDGLALTPEGESLRPLADEMARAAEAIERRRATLVDRFTGNCRIAVDEWSAHFLASRLPFVRSRLPGMTLELASSHLFANLSRREADLALWNTLPESGDLVTRRAGGIACAAYAARGLFRGPPPDLATALAGADWVAHDEAHSHFPTMRWLAKTGALGRATVRCSHYPALLEAVRAGGGVGLLPCFAGDADPALVRIGGPIDELTADYRLLVHRDLRRTCVQVVMGCIVELFAAERHALLGDQDCAIAARQGAARAVMVAADPSRP